METEPVYDETNKRWIGFQAKFFDHDVDYGQIKHSAEKTVEYYTGKEGIVNLVFFSAISLLHLQQRDIQMQ